MHVHAHSLSFSAPIIIAWMSGYTFALFAETEEEKDLACDGLSPPPCIFSSPKGTLERNAVWKADSWTVIRFTEAVEEVRG